MKWKLVDMDVTWWRMWKMSCGSCVLRSSLWSYWSSSLRRVARRCESYDESWVSGAAGRYSSAMKSRILVFIVMMRMSVESSFLLFYIYNSSTGRERKMIWPMRRIIGSSSLSRSISCLIACQWWRWMYLFELTHLHFFFLWCFIFLRHAFIRVLFKFAWFLVTLTPLPLRINHDRIFK